MTHTHRPYTNSDADFAAVKAMLNITAADPALDDNWDPGRFDWWRSSGHGDKPQSWFEANAHTWHAEDGSVIGLFISESGREDCFIVAHPAHLDLLPDILAWGLREWAPGKAQVVMSIFPHDTGKVAVLEAAGFVKGRKEVNLRTYDLAGYDFSYTLQPGFTLTHFMEYGNYASRVALVQNAFDNPGYNETRLRAIHASKSYHADLELIIVSPDGQAVGYCIGWITERDPTCGYIEPMGVHSDFRRMGFGTALAKECFKRLASKGVRWVEIASDVEPNISNLLYESLQPVKKRSAYEFVLPLTEHVDS